MARDTERPDTSDSALDVTGSVKRTEILSVHGKTVDSRGPWEDLHARAGAGSCPAWTAAVDLVEYVGARPVQQCVEASVTDAYVGNAPLPVCQWKTQDGLREVVEGGLVLEGYTPDRLGMPDLAQQKQSDHGCLEGDGQVTQADEEAPQKLRVGAEEHRDPG